MPPSAAIHSYGDFSIAAATNPARHGYGKFSLPSNIELNADAATPQFVKTLNADLTVQSAKNTYIKSLLGNVEVNSQANYLLDAVTSTATLSGKSSISAAQGIEHTASASSFLRTSAGALDVSATNGAFTAAGKTSAAVSSSEGNVSLSATAVGTKVDLDAPLVNVAAGLQGFSVSATGTGISLEATGGNYTLSAPTGNAVTSAANDVRFSTTSGDFSATVSSNDKAFKAIAHQVELGKDASSTTTAKGNFTVAGNLVVSGTTTAIDTVNMAVKDNLVQLNSAPGSAGRYPGLLMARHADDHAGVAGDESATFIFDEGIDRFKLGYTADNAESPVVSISRAADLEVEKLYCSDVVASNFSAASVSIPNFASKAFTIDGNSFAPVVPEPTLDHYGAYELIVRGPDGGSHGSWRISKSSSASASFVAVGAAIQGEAQDELISVDWPANSPPVFYHSVTRTDGNAAPIEYKLKYLSV